MTKKILFAASSGTIRHIASALENDFTVVQCGTLDDARVALQAGGFDLIACSTHFDESRMFDLLRHAKLQPGIRDLPFLCLKIVDDEVSATFLQGVEIAARALGADSFVDFSTARRERGEPEALQELKRLIGRLLA